MEDANQVINLTQVTRTDNIPAINQCKDRVILGPREPPCTDCGAQVSPGVGDGELMNPLGERRSFLFL